VRGGGAFHPLRVDNEQLGTYRAKDENGGISSWSARNPTLMFLSFYAYSARLLLACSCASSDSSSLPMR
jgi:hypothetical protein